ncbi:hypothetical protein HJ001_23625 [Vibrio parahaemolyticus]|nr:hypothetical protein [Vibrio parahaemolyticus]MBE4530666.1 hypothetical protein [Vibrio parahaemolyticus]
MRKQCGTPENKYNPELHQKIVLIINNLLDQLDYSHALQLSAFMPLVIITRMMEQGNTLEQVWTLSEANSSLLSLNGTT